MGTYNMNVNQSKKVYEGKIEGTFSSEDGLNFISSYNKDLSTFNPKEYTISFDCTELNVSTPDVTAILEQCYIMYKKSGFKKVTFKIKNNPILKMQLNRLAKKTGLENSEVLEV